MGCLRCDPSECGCSTTVRPFGCLRCDPSECGCATALRPDPPPPPTFVPIPTVIGPAPTVVPSCVPWEGY
jgi:hypothetical protein